MTSEPEPLETLASALLTLAEGESVRAIEALASTLVNRRNAGQGFWLPGAASALPGLQETPAIWRDGGEACEAVCRRVARRALSGSLQDPTAGATAFHHVDTLPVWARERSPIAVYGRYLFYRVQAAT